MCLQGFRLPVCFCFSFERPLNGFGQYCSLKVTPLVRRDVSYSVRCRSFIFRKFGRSSSSYRECTPCSQAELCWDKVC